MSDPITFRIFVNNDDALMLEEMSKQYNITLVFGGPPPRVSSISMLLSIDGFTRDRNDWRWSVAYITGNIHQIIQFKAHWLRYLKETTPIDA